MNIRHVVAALAIALAPIQSHAYEVDTEKYFAYATVPPENSHMSGYYVLLSDDRCQGKAWKNGWKQALIHYRHGGEKAMCWKEDEDDRYNLIMCFRISDATSGACLPASKSGFFETSSLPASPRF